MACRLSSGTQATEHAGVSSSVAACGILVPQSGTEPVPPTLQGRFSSTEPPGESPQHEFLVGHNSVYSTYYMPAFLKKCIHVK